MISPALNQLMKFLRLFFLPAVGTLLLAGCEQKIDHSKTAASTMPQLSAASATNITTDNVNVGGDTNLIAPAAPITNPAPAELLNTNGTYVTKKKKSKKISATNKYARTESSPTNAAVALTNGIYASNPTPPADFFTGEFAARRNYYLHLRAGYEHGSRDDNNNTVFASAKFYAHGDDLRVRAEKNAWLVPDADLEFSHEVLAKPDGGATTGSEDGVKLRGTFFWPWLNWTTPGLRRADYACPFCQPIALALGPTLNLGFDQILDGSRARFARYGGVRLTFNRDSFIEYTAGETGGLSGTRQQIMAELPFYESRDGEIRFMFRGLWNTGANSSPDFFQAGVFVEMPICIFTQPDKWRDFIPFAK
jgi:hypothetical protein